MRWRKWKNEGQMSNDSLSLFMRVRVSISVSKPLRRGYFVSDSEGNRTWLSFKYEKLGMFCYFCGYVGHNLKHCAGFFAVEKNGATTELQYGDWLKAVGGRQKSVSRAEGEMRLVSELPAQIRTVQREKGGASELAAQHIVEPRVTPQVFPKNIPRNDTGSRDKESVQRINQGAWAEADFMKVWRRLMRQLRGQELLHLTQVRRICREISVRRD